MAEVSSPLVILRFACPGHPESGFLWEQHLGGILTDLGWRGVPDWNGIFVHINGSILIVYVDDLLMIVLKCLRKEMWDAIGQHVLFKDPNLDVERYLGAYYSLSPLSASEPDAPRVLLTSMEDYILRATAAFQEELGRPLKRVQSPYLPEAELQDPEGDADESGIFAPTCASHAATVLFLSRVCRPDVSTATQKVCQVISRWSTLADKQLTRLMSYLHYHADWQLCGVLGPGDLNDLEVRHWPDADWNGDPAHTRSTAGTFLELYSPSSGNTFPLTWTVSNQHFTASSSAESEVVSYSNGLRHEALPVQSLMEVFLGQRLYIINLVDNTQALAACEKGYSKRLHYLARTHRVALGVMHDLLHDPDQCITSGYVQSALQKGDIFTKVLPPAPFVAARELIGMVPGSSSKPS